MIIEGAPIRKQAKREYEKVLREMDRTKAEIERFHSEDRPKFQRWMSKNFGALLTEIRELEQKLGEAHGLVSEVEREFFFGNYRSIHKAYEKVKKQRTNPEPEEEEEFAEGEEERGFREAAEEFGRIMDEMFSKAEKDGNGEEFDSFEPARKGKPERKATPEQQHRGARIKELYRGLVRRLHPDQAEKLTAKHVEWWHQTQAAYEAGNLEQLELIFTMTEIERGGTKEASISILKKLTLQFKLALKSVKLELKKLREDPAWNFAALKDFTLMFNKIRNSLEEDKQRMIIMTQKYLAQIQRWEESSKQGRKRVRTVGSAWQDEEWF